jgi:hypothetical protein
MTGKEKRSRESINQRMYGLTSGARSRDISAEATLPTEQSANPVMNCRARKVNESQSTEKKSSG